jgi:hypothetical protein
VADRDERDTEGPRDDARRPSREEIIAALERASEPAQGPDDMRSRIIIKPGGEVIIENLSLDLMELAMALDPDSGVACELPQTGGEDPDTKG